MCVCVDYFWTFFLFFFTRVVLVRVRYTLCDRLNTVNSCADDETEVFRVWHLGVGSRQGVQSTPQWTVDGCFLFRPHPYRTRKFARFHTGGRYFHHVTLGYPSVPRGRTDDPERWSPTQRNACQWVPPVPRVYVWLFQMRYRAAKVSWTLLQFR